MPMHAKYSPSEGSLFFALLWNDKTCQINGLLDMIAKDWGAITQKYEVEFFPMSSYYSKEMGEDLKRMFLQVRGSYKRKSLITAKTWSMEKEREYAQGEKRSVNIDPGLLLLEQALLISTKPYSHRIYLSQNLYAELLYIFESGTYRPLPWTYPDYLDSSVISNFNQWRKALLA